MYCKKHKVYHAKYKQYFYLTKLLEEYNKQDITNKISTLNT